MNGYAITRLVHGYWRWAVLAALVAVLARAVAGLRARRDWAPADERAARRFVAAVDLQLLLGLVLYFVYSPYFLALRQSFGAAMKDPTTRFFAIEHQVAMLVAVAIAHAGRVRARRAAEPRRKHRVMLVTALLFLVVIAWAIPWPGRAVARPLARTSLSSLARPADQCIIAPRPGRVRRMMNASGVRSIALLDSIESTFVL